MKARSPHPCPSPDGRGVWVRPALFNAGLEQARALVAAAIVRNLDARNLSTRDAEKLTGVSHSEFSRIRNAQLRRFTLERMIAILGKLDADVEVSFRPRTARPAPHAA